MAARHEAWIDNLLEGVDANEAQQMTDQLERIARKNTKKGA